MVMAEVYTRCGEYDKALDELDYLLSLHSSFTVNSLKLASWADPLRNLPRYHELMRMYALDSQI